MYRTTKQINKEKDLNITYQLDLKYLLNVPPNNRKTQFSQVHMEHRTDYLSQNKSWLRNHTEYLFQIWWKINTRRKTRKSTNMYKSNNILLSNQWVKEIAREIFKYLKMNEKINITYKNIRNTMKAEFRKSLVVIP